MPPAVEPAPLPTAITMPSVRNAPDVKTVSIWLTVTTEKPVVENAEIIMKTPRRKSAGRPENSVLDAQDAVKTTVMNTSQSTVVRVSMSRKRCTLVPFHSLE